MLSTLTSSPHAEENKSPPPSLPKVAKSSTTSNDDDTTIYEDTLVQTVEASGAWVLGFTCLDHCVFVVDDRIILSSLRHLSLNFAFTLNLLAHSLALLKDIGDIVHLSLHEHKALERRRHGSFVGTWAKATTSL